MSKKIVSFSLVLQKASRKISMKLHKYPSAARGYHYYGSYWQSIVGEELDSMYERDNIFDLFAIKVIKKTTVEMVGHLPMENSRVRKYLMGCGARFAIVLTSSHHCFSPLFQGGLEISCEVGIYLPSTQKNKELVGIYDNLKPQIYPLSKSFIIGWSLQTSEEVSSPTVNKSKKNGGEEKKKQKEK